MHEVIICEKPNSAERIANAISSNVKKFKYNKKVSYWEIDEGDKKIQELIAKFKVEKEELAKENEINNEEGNKDSK